ncbi:MAG: YhcB family protein [Idiomarina sp.]|nr:YhcB family protein [Idiomarina sp.]
MDWFVGLLLVIVGAVIGFFGARYYFTKYSDSAQLQAQVDASREQLAAYRKDVVEHFQTARQLSDQLSDTQHKLNAFLADSQNMLQQEKEWQQPLPFFAEDTIRQLRAANTLDNDSRYASSEDASDAPRDYSEHGSSGLLSASDAKKSAQSRD